MSNSSEQLTIPQALQTAKQAGFSAVSAPFIVAIALAETGGTLQTHPQDNINLDPSLMGGPYYGSRDRGILQINNVAHPEVSDSCAYDPICAFQAAFHISSGGTNFGQWSTTNVNPATGQPYYQPYLAQTQAAASGLPFSDVPPLNTSGTQLDIGPSWLNPGNLPVVGGAANWFSNLPLLGNNWWAKQATNAFDSVFKGLLSTAWNSVKGAGSSILHFSERVGLVMLGGILVIVGIFVVFTGTNTGKQLTVTAAKAAAA